MEKTKYLITIASVILIMLTFYIGLYAHQIWLPTHGSSSLGKDPILEDVQDHQIPIDSPSPPEDIQENKDSIDSPPLPPLSLIKTSIFDMPYNEVNVKAYVDSMGLWKEQDLIYSTNSIKFPSQEFIMNREKLNLAIKNVYDIMGSGETEKYAFIAYYTQVGRSVTYLSGLVALIASWVMSGSKFQMVVLSASKLPISFENSVSNVPNLSILYITDDLISKTKDTDNAWEISFNKLIAYRLTQFKKVVLLDTDLIMLQNVDELLGMSDMSTALDTWGECTQRGMNAGVFVFSPEIDKWKKIKSYALKHNSCLSGNFRWFDQELLICLYSSVHSKTIPENLGEMYQIPVVYNVFHMNCNCKGSSTDPNVFRYSLEDTKILHYAASSKPYEEHVKQYNSTVEKSEKGEGLSCYGKHVIIWGDFFHYGLKMLGVDSVEELLET